MRRAARLVLICTMLTAARIAFAGPAEEANVAVERWSAAYTSNDLDAVVQCYWPDAMPLGTVSPVMSEGADAIRIYFTPYACTGRSAGFSPLRMRST
jgi:hypothetical protein